MDGPSVKNNVHFVYEFKTPNGILPLGYNKYSFPYNCLSHIENEYDEKETVFISNMDNPTEYSSFPISYQTRILDRGKRIDRVLTHELDENSINEDDLYIICFESFANQVLFEYYGTPYNNLDNLLSPKLIKLFKENKNFKILFIDIWEGSYEHSYNLFENINSFLDKNNILGEGRVFVSGNNVLLLEMDNSKINPSGVNRIKRFINDQYINDSGKFISEIRASKNNLILSEDYVYSLQNELKFEEKSKYFLMYNRNTSRLHRPYFVMKLWESNLLEKGFVSLIQNDEFESRMTELGSSLDELNLDVDDFNKLATTYKNFYPLTIDEENGEKIAWFHNFLSRSKEYEESFFTIVGETNGESEYLFITEKTMKPIMNLHPFFVMGNPNTIKYLQTLGFKTFGDFWDESYDSEKNYKKRCDMIITEVEKLCNKPQSEMIEMIKNMESILIHNKKLLHSFYTKNRTEKILLENLN
jgi:hypothetical protein